ncbi:Gldg family protein [Abyssibacter profundi]|uniref:ABC transporter n=1 Tax=Abyssibacter profundi TaxID=2182787 RepID=A0A363ULW2_9GAMM|nr:Gldg family protein [Abyssibacter profundi]PWN56416.1 ABC transporter [Abyssibacter profundi]
MNQTKLFSRWGLALVAVIALAIIALANTLFGGVRMDLTENKLYTLSDGARNILRDLDEPINLYFFYSRDAASDVPAISTYAARVREMLREMEDIGGDKVRLTEINPEPFSEAEDRAAEFGLQGVPLDAGETLYFGLAGTNSVDEVQVIPFFQLNQESLLEYDLAKLIYQLSQQFKPTLGLISGLDMGGSFNPQTMQPGREWMLLDQLRQFFLVEEIDAGAESLPEDIESLMVVHPAGLSDELLYAIDQFVLGGGGTLVFVDPFAETAAQSSMGMADDPKPTSSDLATLLEPWGLTMDPQQVVGDGANALAIQSRSGAPAYHLGLIGLGGESLSQDDVITQGLDSVNFGYAGALKISDSAELEITPLIQSSAESALIPAFRIQPGMDPNDLRRGFAPDDERYNLAVRLRGPAPSAFGDQPPAGVEPEAHRSQSDAPINLVVVADTDVLRDNLWVQVQNFFGQTMATPFASNGDLVVNAVDNLLGSSDLIGIRARASFSRPFEVVEQLKRQAEGRYLETERELQAALRDTERKITELQSQGGEGDAFILTPEQQDAIEQFRQEKVRIRRQLRDVQHELNKDIEQLGTTLKFINIGLVPLLLALGALVIGWRRAHRRAA